MDDRVSPFHLGVSSRFSTTGLEEKRLLISSSTGLPKGLRALATYDDGDTNRFATYDTTRFLVHPLVPPLPDNCVKIHTMRRTDNSITMTPGEPILSSGRRGRTMKSFTRNQPSTRRIVIPPERERKALPSTEVLPVDVDVHLQSRIPENDRGDFSRRLPNAAKLKFECQLSSGHAVLML